MSLFTVRREGKSDITITGLTDHAKERMNQRSVTPAAVAEALLRPVQVDEERTDNQGRTSVRVRGRTAEVAISLNTQAVVSVNPLSTARKIRLGILSVLVTAGLGYLLHPEFRDYINGKINSGITSLPQAENPTPQASNDQTSSSLAF